MTARPLSKTPVKKNTERKSITRTLRRHKRCFFQSITIFLIKGEKFSLKQRKPFQKQRSIEILILHTHA